MRCGKAQIWLQGYVDGELSPRRAKRLLRHLERCAACRRARARLSELKTLLSENRPQPVLEDSPELFWSQVRARIQGEVAPRRPYRVTFELAWPRVFAWCTATVVVGALTAFLWLRQPRPEQVVVAVPARPALPKVTQIVTRGPDLYAQAYSSEKSRATIIWTEGMPVISLDL